MTLARRLILVAALATLVGGVWVAASPPLWWRFALAAVVAASAHLFRQELRLNTGVLYLTWGEAALIIALYLVPGAWAPVAIAVGSVLAAGSRAAWTRQRISRSQSSITAILILASAVGAGLSSAVANPYAASLTGPVAFGLGLAAVGYTVTSAGLLHLLLVLQGRAQAERLLLRHTLAYKVPLLAAGIVVGLTAIALVRTEWRWLLVLPLAMWLLHRAYSLRVRGRERRRMWSALAAATRSLNRPDVAAVAVAGARGALAVFAVGRTEVEVHRGPGPATTWQAVSTGEVHLRPPVPQEGIATAAPLLAGGEVLGQLRVYFPETAAPGNGEYAALRAYADALAAALCDTTTHEELHRVLTRSVHDAQHDRLTGLLNRSSLLARGETAVQLVPHGSPVALLLVDVDHFREINDSLGHASGDRVLEVTGQRLREQAGPAELVGRLGGDEFALLMVGGASLAEAEESAAQRGRELVRLLAQEASINEVTLSIETSVGVVAAPAGTADMTELLRRADSAMRQAKQGGGTVGRYQVSQDAASSDQPALLAELRCALARDGELLLVLQPVVDLTTGAPTGVEALVRWQHPQRGLLLPAEFVRTVENSDLLSKFTEYVIDKALTSAAAWARHSPAVPVAVNLSARSLLDPRLSRMVAGLLRRHRLPGRLLIIEITETVFTSELPGVDEALVSLRALGVRLSVDDFGTGYASLTLLTRLPLDEVKLDGEFVRKAADSLEAEAIVRTAVELGREIGMRVVAEGVETASQQRLLTRLGCTAGQGFHLAMPIPAERIGALLRSMSSEAQRAEVVGLRRTS